jgi:hypothetical protein
MAAQDVKRAEERNNREHDQKTAALTEESFHHSSGRDLIYLSTPLHERREGRFDKIKIKFMILTHSLLLIVRLTHERPTVNLMAR